MANPDGMWKAGDRPSKNGYWAIYESGNGSWHRILRDHRWFHIQDAQEIVNAHNRAMGFEPAAETPADEQANLFAFEK